MGAFPTLKFARALAAAPGEWRHFPKRFTDSVKKTSAGLEGAGRAKDQRTAAVAPIVVEIMSRRAIRPGRVE